MYPIITYYPQLFFIKEFDSIMYYNDETYHNLRITCYFQHHLWVVEEAEVQVVTEA